MTSDGPDGPDPRTARWTDLTGDARGATYDARWERLAAEGRSVHGEADLLEDLSVEGDRSFGPPPTVLDAGCGTGRIAIELADRGFDAIGVDRDADLLATARTKAAASPLAGPGRGDLRWIEADLVDLGRVVDARSVELAVLAGNVMIFVDPGTEAAVVAAVAGTLAPDGLLVTGFQVRPGGYGPDRLDRDATAAGLHLVDRWATWDRRPWSEGGDYQVSVHILRVGLRVVGAAPEG
jgi:SAM-dependent methyltransferase